MNKNTYYLNIAKEVSKKSTCLRRQYGAVLVKNDEIIATGYTGAPRGRCNCIELGYCTKKKIFPEVRHGGYDACRSVHAEQNAIISADRKSMIGGTIYLVGKTYGKDEYVENARPCALCKRMIINAGLKEVVIRLNKEEYIKIPVSEFIENDESLEGNLGY